MCLVSVSVCASVSVSVAVSVANHPYLGYVLSSLLS